MLLTTGGLVSTARANGETLVSAAELDPLVVIGQGQSAVYARAQPVVVLDKEAIDRNPGNTLGSLLDDVPGVSNASFGPGVGRPVIRGIGGSRVKILVNGSDSADVSAMSSDHAPMADALSAERVEILYGPTTLLYGGGAVGGVVNVVDQRIHEVPVEESRGSIALRGSTVDQGYGLDALLDAGRGNWSFHLNGFERHTREYRSGARGTVPDGFRSGRIANSDSQSQGAALAMSWSDSRSGFLGGSVGTLQHHYGVPNLDGALFRVTPDQWRFDLKGAWRPTEMEGWGWLEEWRTELAHNDYAHAETGEAFDIPGAEIVNVGLFEQETWELRSRLRHVPLGAWQGDFGIQVTLQHLALCHDHGGCPDIPSFSEPWDGEMGFNLANRERDGFRLSHDTPMPLTRKLEAGAFIVETLDWRRGTLEVGARVDRISLSANPDPIDPNWRQARSYYADRSYAPLSLSTAGTWALSERQRIGLSLARVQRAPDPAELFWNGDHHATFSFQLDNPDLRMETAWTADLNWLHETDRNSYRVAVFRYHYQDYIYNDLKAFPDPFHGNDVYRHEQDDARFFGAELSWQHRFVRHWTLDLGAEFVNAERRDGRPLPRTPPAGLMAAVRYTRSAFDARVTGQVVQAQNETAENERASPGHHLLHAQIAYQLNLGPGDMRLMLAAQNLTDQYAINHVSFLKQAAPLAGRNIQLSARWTF